MTAVASFWIACPACSQEFEVDSAKIPMEGVHAICSFCTRTFLVAIPAPLETDDWMPEAPAVQEAPALSEIDLASESEEPAEVRWETVAEASSTVEALPEAPPPLEATSPFEDLSGFVTDASVEDDDDPSADVSGKSLSEGANRFGRRDPGERARRLARVLVSDIIAYHPERYRTALAAGTLKAELADEVERSWEEFVQQVGLEVAESTPYFTEALNEVLAKGEEVF